MRRTTLLGAFALCLGALLWSKSTPAEQPAPPRTKRVVRSIELSTKKGTPFLGRVMVALVSDPSQKPTEPASPVLAYYWGGRCKGTDLPPSRVELLLEAMKEGYAVEIHAFPIEHEKAVVMCMQSIRISKE